MPDLQREGPPAGNRGADANLTSRATEDSNQYTPYCSALTGDLRDYVNLSEQHAQELFDSAIPGSVASEQGVYTAFRRSDLPSWAQWITNDERAALPALVYPMLHPDDSETGQVKPAEGSVTGAKGHVLKYVSPKTEDNPPKFPVLRHVSNAPLVLIVEGVKQALAALAWAPADWSIYRIAGIWSWRVVSEGHPPGTPSPYLAAVQDQHVVIVPDADAKTNVAVFDGATALGEACESYGAKSVKFAQLPGGGKDGLDDVLAGLPVDKRQGMLKSWASRAKNKPAELTKSQVDLLRNADARERAQKQAEANHDGRVSVNIDSDTREVVRKLVDALKDQRGGKTIFQLGGRLVRLRRPDRELISAELNLDSLHRELLDTTRPVSTQGKNAGPSSTPVPKSLLGVAADHWDEFPRLTGISRSPVVRPDGTILTKNGYDEQTGLVVDLTDDVRGIEVPNHPTDADIASARSLLRDDLFARDGAEGYDGWLFREASDQTNAVAAMLTLLLRSSTGPAPLNLFDGLQRGVGKNELIETIHQVTFGVSAPVQATPAADDEMDKRVTAQLMKGATSVVLDEVQEQAGRCRLDSRSLSAALTSEVYRGRELGRSTTLDLPNLATYFASGNNVQVPADMARRVCPVRLGSDRRDVENRDNFRHDLKTWVPEHRRELLRACMMLIRAWFDRGQPVAPNNFGFASFTKWQRIVGGILHLGGFRDFLGNVREVRETTDSEAIDNLEHWEWLEEKFPNEARFPVSEVLIKARSDGDDAPPPYGMSWDNLDARGLSMYYRQHPKWYGDLRIKTDGMLHGKKKAYVVERHGASPGADVGSGDKHGGPPPGTSGTRSGKRSAAGAGPGETIDYQDRNGFVKSVARAMPEMEGTTIAELGGGR